jgi:hypothetical protein
MMPITPLGGSSGAPDSVEIDCNYLGFGALLRHLRRLPGCRVGWRFAWPITDDFWATFHYKGFAFEIDSPFADYWVTRAADCPPPIFEEVIAHLEGYQPSAFARWVAERAQRRAARWMKRFERAVEEGKKNERRRRTNRCS